MNKLTIPQIIIASIWTIAIIILVVLSLQNRTDTNNGLECVTNCSEYSQALESIDDSIETLYEDGSYVTVSGEKGCLVGDICTPKVR